MSSRETEIAPRVEVDVRVEPDEVIKTKLGPVGMRIRKDSSEDLTANGRETVKLVPAPMARILNRKTMVLEVPGISCQKPVDEDTLARPVVAGVYAVQGPKDPEVMTERIFQLAVPSEAMMNPPPGRNMSPEFPSIVWDPKTAMVRRDVDVEEFLIAKTWPGTV